MTEVQCQSPPEVSSRWVVLDVAAPRVHRDMAFLLCAKCMEAMSGGDISGMLSLLLLLEVKKNHFHQQLLDFSFGVKRQIPVFMWIWCATLIFLSLNCV